MDFQLQYFFYPTRTKRIYKTTKKRGEMLTTKSWCEIETPQNENAGMYTNCNTQNNVTQTSNLAGTAQLMWMICCKVYCCYVMVSALRGDMDIYILNDSNNTTATTMPCFYKKEFVLL